MKYRITLYFLLTALLASFSGFAQSSVDNTHMTDSKKILVAYFSHSGNTRYVAERIHSLTGGDLFEIKTLHQYSEDYDTVVDEARKELKSNARPELSTHLQNAASYDVILLGYPNWWGTYPMAVATFLEENDFSGKTIVPFCTHEGSRLGNSLRDLAALCPDSIIGNGLDIRGRSVSSASAEDAIQKWLEVLDL